MQLRSGKFYAMAASTPPVTPASTDRKRPREDDESALEEGTAHSPAPQAGPLQRRSFFHRVSRAISTPFSYSAQYFIRQSPRGKDAFVGIDQVLSRAFPVCPMNPALICAVADSGGREGRRLFDAIRLLVDEYAMISGSHELKTNSLYELMGLFAKFYDSWLDTAAALEIKEAGSSQYTLWSKSEVDCVIEFLLKLQVDISTCNTQFKLSRAGPRMIGN
jgi:hypothetical protein